jgi:hypothetical protein
LLLVSSLWRASFHLSSSKMGSYSLFWRPGWGKIAIEQITWKLTFFLLPFFLEGIDSMHWDARSTSLFGEQDHNCIQTKLKCQFIVCLLSDFTCLAKCVIALLSFQIRKWLPYKYNFLCTTPEITASITLSTFE